jgi:hypothetical protein
MQRQAPSSKAPSGSLKNNRTVHYAQCLLSTAILLCKIRNRGGVRVRLGKMSRLGY